MVADRSMWVEITSCAILKIASMVIQIPQYRTFPERNAAGTFKKHNQKYNRYVLSCDSNFVLRL